MGMHMRNSYSLMCVCLVTRRDRGGSGAWYPHRGLGQRTHILVQTQALAPTGNKAVSEYPSLPGGTRMKDEVEVCRITEKPSGLLLSSSRLMYFPPQSQPLSNRHYTKVWCQVTDSPSYSVWLLVAMAMRPEALLPQ